MFEITAWSPKCFTIFRICCQLCHQSKKSESTFEQIPIKFTIIPSTAQWYKLYCKESDVYKEKRQTSFSSDINVSRCLHTQKIRNDNKTFFTRDYRWIQSIIMIINYFQSIWDYSIFNLKFSSNNAYAQHNSDVICDRSPLIFLKIKKRNYNNYNILFTF